MTYTGIQACSKFGGSNMYFFYWRMLTISCKKKKREKKEKEEEVTWVWQGESMEESS